MIICNDNSKNKILAFAFLLIAFDEFSNFSIISTLLSSWIKLENFQKNPNKLGYLYLLTPKGFSAKTTLTTDFLKSMLEEYDRLKAEIASLSAEVENSVND